MADTPELTVLIPVFDEQETIGPLLAETVAVVGQDPARVEILVVDDGSRDRTGEVLRRLEAEYPAQKVISFAENAGQSAALSCGFLAARGRYLVTLDGDGQSDPRDIPAIRGLLDEHDMVCGIRRNRHDSLSRRLGSRFANWARRLVTGDRVEDICCPSKGFHTEQLRDLPYFDGAHRFLPILLGIHGRSLAQVQVNHRPRAGGSSKYGNWGRLLKTWQDLLAINWMQRRRLRYRIKDAS